MVKYEFEVTTGGEFGLGDGVRTLGTPPKGKPYRTFVYDGLGILIYNTTKRGIVEKNDISNIEEHVASHPSVIAFLKNNYDYLAIY